VPLPLIVALVVVAAVIVVVVLGYLADRTGGPHQGS